MVNEAEKLFAASDLSVVHLNGQYLAKETDSNLNREVVYLRSVCWLDISGKFENVQPGRYFVCWKIKFGRDFHAREPLNARAEVFRSGQEVSEFDVDQKIAVPPREKWDQWLMVKAGPVTVYPGDDLATIRVRFWSRNPWWMYDMYWDYVELRPAFSLFDLCCNKVSGCLKTAGDSDSLVHIPVALREKIRHSFEQSPNTFTPDRYSSSPPTTSASVSSDDEEDETNVVGYHLRHPVRIRRTPRVFFRSLFTKKQHSGRTNRKK